MLENTMTNAVLRSRHRDEVITTSYVAMPQLTYADNSGVGKANIQILLFPLTTMILLPSVAQVRLTSTCSIATHCLIQI
jgi:hypothetical protein